MTDFGYRDARAVESAIKDAAKSAHAADPIRQTGDLIRQVHYDGSVSSREKDLVDLVVIATTQHVDGAALEEAIRTECARRRLTVPEKFAIPGRWGPGYTKLAVNTPAQPYPISAARRMVSAFIDPVLGGGVRGRWDPPAQVWRPSSARS